MAAVPLPPPPVRLGVGFRTLYLNEALLQDLLNTVDSCRGSKADVLTLALMSVYDRHGYYLELQRER